MRDVRDESGGVPAELGASHPGAGDVTEVVTREELRFALLGGFVHDVASPLAVLTSNLPLVRPDDAEAGELGEIVDDLELAVTRLRELTGDLRLYVGASSQGKTFDELVRTALRLSHSQLVRRVDVLVEIDASLRSEAPGPIVLRALSESFVAIGRELIEGVRHRFVVRADAHGLFVELSPGARRDPTRTLVTTLSSLAPPVVRSSAESLQIHVALRWSGPDAADEP